MQPSQTRTHQLIQLKRTGRIFFIVSACICSIAVYGIFLLPSLLSLETTKTIIERSLEKILGAPCGIGDIHCSWTKGIQVSGLHLYGKPDGIPETILQIDTVALDVPVRELITQGRAGIRLFVTGVLLNIARDAQGKTNIDFLTASQSVDMPPQVPEAGEEKAGARFALPVDIGAVIELRQLSVFIDDQVTDKRLRVENGEVILNAPSIQSRDAELRLHMDIALNERQLPPVDLTVSAAGIVNPATGTIAPETIAIKADGTLPGTRLSVSGRLAKQGLRSDVRINLQEIFETASPLLESRIASSRLEGTLAISAILQLKAKDRIAFDTTVFIDQASLSGPLLQGRSISGFNLLLANTGEIDPAGKLFRIATGRLDLLQQSSIRYHGRMSLDPKAAGQDSFFSLDTAAIDIGELLKFVHPLLPPDLPVQFGEGEDSPALHISQVSLHGDLLAGDCAVTVEKLNLNVPAVRVDEKDVKVQVHDIDFNLYGLTTGLQAYFPKDVRFDSSLNVDAVSVDSAQTVQVKKIAVPRFQFQINGIRKSPEAMFGYAADLSGKQQLTVGEIQVPPLVVVMNVNQALDGVCRLLPEHKIQVGVREVHLGAADVNITHDSIGNLQTSVDVDGVISQLEINSLQPFLLDITDFRNQIQVGDMASLGMTTEIRDTAIQKAETRGNLRIHLGRLYQSLAKKPDLVSLLDGTVLLHWQINARRPTPSELAILKKGMITDLHKDLPFIEELQTAFSLSRIRTDLAGSANLNLQLKDVTAEPLFAYQYDGKDGRGDFSGSLAVGSLRSTSLPVRDETVSARFSFSGSHQGLNQVSLVQDLEIAPFGLTESVNLTLSGLAQSVFQNREKNLSYFLKKTGGSFSGNIGIRDMVVINQLQKDIVATGGLQAGLHLLLVPGTRLGGDAWVHFSGVGLEKAGQFHVQDLSGDIRLEKEYLLSGTVTDTVNAVQNESRSHLSNQVLQWNTYSRTQTPVHFSGGGQKGFQPYSMPYQEKMIRFASAESKGGPLPIRLQHFQTGLELVQGLPRIHNFQVDLLGGTIISSLAVQKTGSRFFIPVNVSFSGIQTERFWGITVNAEQKKDTEVTGRFDAYVPVTTQKNEFLNDLNIDVLFTHIGRMALEQLLYSLDPTESNEKIVSQRKLVEQGSPKWIQLTVKDGALSLEGVVTVRGVDIDIPQVRRLNISGLSGLDALEDGLEKLAPVLTILQRLSANGIQMNPEQNSVVFFTAPPGHVASLTKGRTEELRTVQ